MREAPDQELVDRVKMRDKKAFAALYDRHAAPIMGLAVRMLRDKAAAEDAVQETFLTLWNKTGLYNPGRGALLSWLFAVCRNVCLDRLKKADYKREIPVAGFALTAFSEGADYAKAGASYAEIHALVTKALAKLKAKERGVIELSFFSGLSHAEIAAELRLPLGTVKSLIAAGLKKLRGEIKADWQFTGDLN